jgi:hypothetical protein
VAVLVQGVHGTDVVYFGEIGPQRRAVKVINDG